MYIQIKIDHNQLSQHLCWLEENWMYSLSTLWTLKSNLRHVCIVRCRQMRYPSTHPRCKQVLDPKITVWEIFKHKRLKEEVGFWFTEISSLLNPWTSLFLAKCFLDVFPSCNQPLKYQLNTTVLQNSQCCSSYLHQKLIIPSLLHLFLL